MTATLIKQPTKINAYKVLELIDWICDEFTSGSETCEIKEVEINESIGLVSIYATLEAEGEEYYTTQTWNLTAEMVNDWENHTDDIRTYYY